LNIKFTQQDSDEQNSTNFKDLKNSTNFQNLKDSVVRLMQLIPMRSQKNKINKKINYPKWQKIVEKKIETRIDWCITMSTKILKHKNARAY